MDPCDSATGRPAVPTRTQRARSGQFAVPSPPSWNSGSRSRPSVRSLAGSTGRRRSKHGTAAPPLRTTLSPLGPHGGVPPRATPRSPHAPQGSPITRERGLSYCGAAKGACRGERSRPRHRPLPSDSRAQGGDGLGGYQSFAREVPILTRPDSSWEWGGRRESRGRIAPKDPEAAGPPATPGEGGVLRVRLRRRVSPPGGGGGTPPPLTLLLLAPPSHPGGILSSLGEEGTPLRRILGRGPRTRLASGPCFLLLVGETEGPSAPTRFALPSRDPPPGLSLGEGQLTFG